MLLQTLLNRGGKCRCQRQFSMSGKSKRIQILRKRHSAEMYYRKVLWKPCLLSKFSSEKRNLYLSEICILLCITARLLQDIKNLYYNMKYLINYPLCPSQGTLISSAQSLMYWCHRIIYVPLQEDSIDGYFFFPNFKALALNFSLHSQNCRIADNAKTMLQLQHRGPLSTAWHSRSEASIHF